MWLNDRFGVGIQGDYLIVPRMNVANSVQGTVRLMWRFGGKTRQRPAALIPAHPAEKVVEYIDVIVRDTIIVEKQVPVESKSIHDLIRSIYFDFDSADLKPEYADVVERIATIMMQDTSRKYLITGYTDIRGDASYNQRLSYRRAESVMNALIDQGVPASILKIKGEGSKVSHAAYGDSPYIRESDRKIIIELITNEDYWNIL
jgi:outer membrane protein OmpA-like peptidoglycan-associated protein